MKLNIYKIIPECYSNFKEICRDLDDIKAIGFSAIRLNPVKSHTIMDQNRQKTQQYYPLNLGDLNIQLSKEKNDEVIKWIQRITAKAVKIGLTPIFDLTPNYFSVCAKGYIDWFVETLGFRGVHINCLAHTNLSMLELTVVYIANKLQNKYKVDVQVIYWEFDSLMELQLVLSNGLGVCK